MTPSVPGRASILAMPNYGVKRNFTIVVCGFHTNIGQPSGLGNLPGLAHFLVDVPLPRGSGTRFIWGDQIRYRL